MLLCCLIDILSVMLCPSQSHPDIAMSIYQCFRSPSTLYPVQFIKNQQNMKLCPGSEEHVLEPILAPGHIGNRRKS